METVQRLRQVAGRNGEHAIIPARAIQVEMQ